MKIVFLVHLLSIFLFPARVLAIETTSFRHCGDRIKKLVCQVAPPLKENDRYTSHRSCLQVDVIKYEKLIVDAFQLYPPFVQQQFCSLKRIYIEEDFFGLAWSAPVNEKTPKEILIGLRKKELDENPPFEVFMRWFEGQTFGAISVQNLSPDLPKVNVIPRQLAEGSFLVLTLLHELGHSFDYQERYNRSSIDPQFHDSWTALQWEDLEKIQASSDFPLRQSICLNQCKGNYLSIDSALTVYSGLLEHGFLSQLASINAMEDFAESFAYYVLTKYMGVHITLTTKENHRYSLTEAIESSSFKKKRKFLERIMMFPVMYSLKKY